MTLPSTVKMGINDGKLLIVADEYIDTVRKDIWGVIHKHSGKISKSDISMVLGLVQYELIHHDEKDI